MYIRTPQEHLAIMALYYSAKLKGFHCIYIVQVQLYIQFSVKGCHCILRYCSKGVPLYLNSVLRIRVDIVLLLCNGAVSVKKKWHISTVL